MIKKTLKYKNYAREEVTDDFYFDINESELLMMNWSERGGLDKYYERIIKEEDNREILRVFKELVDLSFGRRSLDGKDFDKSPEYLRKFKASGAYNQLLLEFFTQDEDGKNNFAEQFAKGLMPDDLIERVRKREEEDAKKLAALAVTPEPSTVATETVAPEPGNFEQPTFE
jgi:hypothetical protein